MLATQSIILIHPNILFHRYSTTVCFETYLPEVLGYAVKTKSDEFPFVVSIMTSKKFLIIQKITVATLHKNTLISALFIVDSDHG